MTDEVIAIDSEVLLEFMYRLGQAYLACGEQTAEVERLLRRTATAFGMRQVEGRGVSHGRVHHVARRTRERVTLAEGLSHGLRLDQIADIHALCNAAERAEVDATRGARPAGRDPAPAGPVRPAGIVAGHHPLGRPGDAADADAHEPRGRGAARIRRGPAEAGQPGSALLALPTPVFAATLVSALTFLAVQYGLPVDPLYLLVPPLVTFLPGAMLTLGMVELAYGDMIAGTSRLITGLVQLVLLAFGLAAGAALVGYAPRAWSRRRRR